MKGGTTLDAKTIAALVAKSKGEEAIFFDGGLPGFGFRIRKSGKRSWILGYRTQNGQQRRMTLGDAAVIAPELARKIAIQRLAEIARGEDPQGQKARARHARKTALRFSAVAADYIADTASTKRPRTNSETRRYLTGVYWRPLHGMVLTEITRADVASALRGIRTRQGDTVASRARAVLSPLFVWAMQQGLVDANPVIGTFRPEQSPPRERVLSDAEMREIWNACDDGIGEFSTIIKLLMLWGARRTEIGGLAWSEIDLDAGTWTLPAARSKNRQPLTLPLLPLARALIEASPRMQMHDAATGDLVDRDPMFGLRSSGGFSAWALAKAALDKRLGGKVGPWTIHDVRRTFATRLSDCGVQPHIVEVILNHRSGFRRGVAGTYNRSPYMREVKAALAVWEDHLHSIIDGSARKVVPMRAL